MGNKKKTKKKYFTPYTFCAAIACVLLAAFVLNGYISLNELTLRTTKKKKELDQIESQNSVISLQIERKNSLGNIEELATEQLGMVKLESFRIQTVNLAGDDSVEIKNEKKPNDFFDGIVSSFNILLEYLN